MTKSAPTYLVLREGIYYFQMRVPTTSKQQANSGSLLIRKSTKTGNKKEALKIARAWWFQVMKKYDAELEAKLKEIDQDGERYDELRRRGKFLYEGLELAAESLQEDEFILKHFNNDFDKGALVAYQDWLFYKRSNARLNIHNGSFIDPALFLLNPHKRLSEIVNDYIEDFGKSWSIKTKEKYTFNIIVLRCTVT